MCHLLHGSAVLAIIRFLQQHTWKRMAKWGLLLTSSLYSCSNCEEKDDDQNCRNM